MKLIYLIGAGRSGTTILATMLNANTKILTVGEMHQFYDHLLNGKPCSCGDDLYTCVFWQNIVDQLEIDENQLKEYHKMGEKMESHSRIPLYLLGWRGKKRYHDSQALIFRSLRRTLNSDYILDSSKYIARYLLLRSNNQIDVKAIYVVRDIRGVVNSFKKNVQTPKSPLSAILYHSLINFFAQLVCWSDPKVIKIRYEDLMTDADATLKKVNKHIFDDVSGTEYTNASYTIPHIIGGNRMKRQKEVAIKFDQAWKIDLSRFSQFVYAFLAMPFMLINKYRW